MKTKLKYLKLFEGISQSDIPGSFYDDGNLDINIPSDLTELPEIYNQLTDEITGNFDIMGNPNLTHIDSFKNLTEIGLDLNIANNQSLTHITGFNSLTRIWTFVSIANNQSLTHITGFNNLTEIGKYIMILSNPKLTHISGFSNLNKIGGHLYVYYNPELTHIAGFDNLTKIRGTLYLDSTPKLILMSIPHTLIKSANRITYTGDYEKYFYKPKDFINDSIIIQDCIYKFNPAIHPDVVVKQIIENLELWGEPDTINTIINHILSKGDYLNLIPESFKQYVEEKYNHLYNAKYANTGARGIAKMNTGRYLGMF